MLGKHCSTVHLEVHHLGQGQILPIIITPAVLLFSSTLLLFAFLHSLFSSSVTRVVHYDTHFRSFSSSLYGFYRAARQISVHQDLLCVRGGEHVCVILWLSFFFKWQLFQFALEDTAAAAAWWGNWLPARLWLRWGHCCFILEGGWAGLVGVVWLIFTNFRQFRTQ